ncbi:MAG: hypothetical protein ACRD4C_04735 [Candidatus Acidiferrales bacterium]
MDGIVFAQSELDDDMEEAIQFGLETERPPLSSAAAIHRNLPYGGTGFLWLAQAGLDCNRGGHFTHGKWIGALIP